MKRRTSLIAALTVLIMGCSPNGPTGADADEPARGPCASEPGGILDVAGEPDWRQFGDYVPWTDAAGCLVRIDVLAERGGPEHCGWEKTRVLITGDPLGSRYFDDATDVIYVRDPGRHYGIDAFVAGFRTAEALPADAVDTGFRQGERELWLSPSDPEAAYIWLSGVAERWPQGDPPLCA